MSRLSLLPSQVLSYIYSFDGTFRDVFRSGKFDAEILVRSKTAHKIIDDYIQELFADGFIWYNSYGTFGNPTEERLKLHYYYPKYQLTLIQDDKTNNIYFTIRPGLEEGIEEELEEGYKRYDGFLTRDAIIEDETYLGIQTYHHGGFLHLFVDDI
jgi:hypothetical protein